MNNCTYTITIDGNSEVAHSTSELQSILWNYLNRDTKIPKGFDAAIRLKIDGVNSKEENLKITEEIKYAFTHDHSTSKTHKGSIYVGEDGEIEEEDKFLNDGLGVNSFIGLKHPGTRNLYLDSIYMPKTEEELKAERYPKFVTEKKGLGFTDVEIEKLWKQQLASEKETTKIGTYLHWCLEQVFKNPNTKSMSYDELQQMLGHISTTKAEFSHFTTTDRVRIQDAAIKCAQSLYAAHPTGTFIPEFRIASKHLSAKGLHLVQGVDMQNTCVYGSIDLLILDGTEAYIYDYKSKTKIFNSKDEQPSWTSRSIGGMYHQINTYANLLKQYGINVSAENRRIIPFFIGRNDFDEENKVSFIENTDGDNHKFIESNSLLKNFTEKQKTIIAKDKQLLDAYFAIHRSSFKKLSENSELITYLFPVKNMNLTGKIEANAISSAWIKNNRTIIKPLEQETGKYYQKGYRYRVDLEKLGILSYFKGDPDVVVNTLYIRPENLDKAVERLAEILSQEKAEQSTSLYGNLQSLLVSRTIEDYNSFLESPLFTPSQKTWLNITLKPYIFNDWDLVSTEEMALNGYYIFKKGKVYDMLILSSEDLNKQYDFSESKLQLDLGQRRTSIAGKFFKDSEIDAKNCVDAKFGNLLIMKGACYIAENLKDFEAGAKINSIRAINLERTQQAFLNNSDILKSYDTLTEGVYLHGDKNVKMKALPETLFEDDWVACYKLAGDIIDSCLEDRAISILSDIPVDKVAYESRIREILERRLSSERQIKHLSKNFEYTEGIENRVAQAFLSRALLAIYGYGLRSENDINTLQKALIAPAMSSSVNQREITNLVTYQNQIIRNNYNKILTTWNKLLSEALKEAGINSFEDANKMFKYWYKTDDNGKINASLELRGASDSYWKNHKAEKALYDYFISMIQEHQLRPESSREESDIRKIPLVKGTFIQRAKEGGFFKAIHGNLKDTWEVIKKPFYDDLDNPENQSIITNEVDREELLASRPQGYYTANLDHVFAITMLQGLRRIARDRFGVLFASAESVIACINDFESGSTKNKQKMETIKEWTDEYLRVKAWNGNLLHDKTLLQIEEVLNKVTNWVSLAQLGFNSRALFREFMTSFAEGLTRSQAKLYDTVTEKDWAEAVKIVCTEADPKLLSWTHQLNLMYGMANADVDQLPQAFQLNRANPANFDSSKMFITSSAPDFYFRTSMLVAKLIADKTMPAYHKNEQGILIYDFKLDPRFEVLRKWDTSNPDFYKQLAHYNMLVDDLNNRRMLGDEGLTKYEKPFEKLTINSGKNAVIALPDGYTTSEIIGIRNYTELLYGHYNEENKALIQDTFFGHFLFLFKTFVSSRIEQGFNGVRATNISQIRMKVNEQGKELYQTIDSDGTIRYKTKEELTGEDIKNGAKPRLCLIGANMPGTLTNLASGAYMLWHFKDNPEEWKKWWKNPQHRASLYLFFMDTFVTMIMMLLTNLLYGKKANAKMQSMKDEYWFKRWTYGVMMGSFQDGPLHNILKSMTDLNPPMIHTLSQWYDSAVSVITGKDNILHAMAENIGMTREFSHYFDFEIVNS